MHLVLSPDLVRVRQPLPDRSALLMGLWSYGTWIKRIFREYCTSAPKHGIIEL